MRFCVFWGTLFVLIGFIGCQERSVAPPIDPPADPPDGAQVTSATPDPQYILDRMITAYQTAISYSDQATVQMIGKMTQSNTSPTPRNCIVAFQKPNKLHLEIHEGIFVADGEDCFAQIRLLPEQVLHVPSPEQWTFETLFQDVHLDTAMELGLPRSVLRFPPQLVLLLANNPLNTFCPKGAPIEWLEQQQINSIQCDVIRISHSDGNRILWISRDNSILLRLEYQQPVGLQVPEGFESIEAIRIEMTDARFDWDFNPETFPMLLPQGAVQVAEFHSDMPRLPTTEEHRHRLKLMTDSDIYRRIDQPESAIPSEQPPPKTSPRTFALIPVWSQSFMGVNTMTLLPDEPSKLIVPYGGNLVATVNLQGKILQEASPKELEDSIIMNIQAVHFPSGERRIGIITLDGKFCLFDESFKPLAAYHVEPDGIKIRQITDFQFIQHYEEALLLLAIQQDSTQENVTANSVIQTVDLQGAKLWEYPFEGVPNQISTTVADDQVRALISCTVSQDQDSILVLALDGTASDPVNMIFGRRIIWFHVLNSTIYALLENTDTGEIWFVGRDERGKGLWGRSLPLGEYEVEPVYLAKEQKWLVPSPSGEFFVFDLIGNMIDTFSLDVIPTGLLCVEVDGATLLVVADGKTVSAWKVR